MTTRKRAVLAAAIVVVVVALGAVRFLQGDDDDAAAPSIETSETADPEFDYVIPAGTADRLAAGETVEILPAEIEAQVGDSIRIDNQDREAHVLGPWYVGPGEVLTQRFASEGELVGECRVHPSGQLRVIVEA